jgi:membrane-associated phospholipid phosphatase
VGSERGAAFEAKVADTSRSALEHQKDDPASWARFPTDLRQSFEAFFSGKNLLPSAVIALGTAAAWPFDDEVQEYWGKRERLGEAGKITGNKPILVGGFGGLIVAGQLVDNRRFRLMTYDLMQGFALNNAITFAAKVAVQRERPDGGNFSFPSGHTSNLFTAARIIGHHHGLELAVPLYLFATFVSIARLDQNSHWMSDTAAGAGLGLLVGHTVVRGSAQTTGGRQVTWMPVLSEATAGVGFFINPWP